MIVIKHRCTTEETLTYYCKLACGLAVAVAFALTLFSMLLLIYKSAVASETTMQQVRGEEYALKLEKEMNRAEFKAYYSAYVSD